MKTTNKEIGYPRIASLTIFRFPLAIWVLFHHLFDENFESNQAPNSWLTIFSDAGSMAVTSFFILSGFVISYSYENSNKPPISSFYSRRILSIYPYFIGTTFAVYFSQPIEREYLLKNIFGIQGFSKSADWFVLNGPSWSVSVEILMYLLFPAVFHIFTKVLHPLRLLMGILVIELLTTIIIGTNSDDQTVFYLLYHFPPFQLFHFLTGILCFKIYKSSQRKIKFSQHTIFLGSTVLFLTSIFLTDQIDLLYFKCGALVVIPTIIFILTSSVASKNKELKSNVVNSLLYKAGQGTFIFYVTHWLWVGSLRSILSSESNQLVMLLKLIILLIPILVISYKLSIHSANVIANKNYYKFGNSMGLFKITTAMSLLIICCLLLGMLNSSFPRHWSTDNLPRNSEITIEILEKPYLIDDNKIQFKVKMANNSILEQEIRFCNIVFTPKELFRYGDLPRPVYVEIRLKLPGKSSTEMVLGTPRLPEFTDSFYLSLACK
jgi:hypothetical protein